MKQVVTINGGNAFSSYDEYLTALKNKAIESLDWFRAGTDWKGTLQEVLGDAYDVISPRMPNKQNAKYLEWKIWFEKLVPFLEDGVILVGHSLGAVFLAKYLAEEHLQKKVCATLLVAGPYNEDTELPKEFSAPDNLRTVSDQGGKIFLYHSKDDPVVPFTELAKYQNALPNATVRVFEDRQHFNQETFPELVADIRSLG